MIKKGGDWTKKLIDTLYEAKKNILKVHKVKAEGVNENDIFELLEDISIKEKLQLKNLYPWIHISRPITAPAETAVYHKNIILIGAGSGIAPYLSLIEEQSFMAD